MAKKSKSNIVKIGLVQMSCDPKPEANLKKAIARIGDAAKRGAQIVCLQELFRSQYFWKQFQAQLLKRWVKLRDKKRSSFLLRCLKDARPVFTTTPLWS